MGMAIESLVKDIAREPFVTKTELPSEMDVIQLESDEENISESDTTTQMLTTKTTTSATPLLKGLSSS
uniref:Uncharacterized protein n=1 Tax=Romanomermis culicivorax TaxID=13658 RepID=A0A915HR31_ROMCU